MQDVIEAGRILIERGMLVPDSWLPQGGPNFNNWISVGKRDRPGLEASIHKAGWTFFYLAGEIRATVFGFDEQETARRAVKRLITDVKAQHLNCLEISQVSMRSFLGVPYATVAGHARHIQEGMVLSRTTPLKSETAPHPALPSPLRRQRREITKEPLSAEEAVEAWEAEGGAPAQTNCGGAAEAKTELSDKESNPMEVVV